MLHDLPLLRWGWGNPLGKVHRQGLQLFTTSGWQVPLHEQVAALPVKPTEEPSLPSPEEDVPEPAEPEPAEAEEADGAVPEETAPESVEKEETEETGPESVEKEETEETGPEPVEKEETEDTEDTAPESVEAEEEKEEKEETEPATSDYVTNVNVANLPGVMWYLHNEVVWQTPRKFNISRVYRHKIMVRATQPLLDLGMNFGVRFAYDAAQCTGPWNCDNYFEKYGYFVGCNNLGMFPFPTYKIYYDDAKPEPWSFEEWFTLPGTCSSNAFEERSNRLSTRDSVEHDLSVDEIEGISDYAAFIKAGNEEFNKTADKGVGLTFWSLGDVEPNNLHLRRRV
eukprot:Skav217899  [mRNA]  locus=scaffold795:41368:50503:+ [translate_table: standard]